MWIRAVLIIWLLLVVSCGSSSGSSSSTATSQGITEQVKVVQGRNHATAVLLPVTIHGQGPFTFELDTGASTSLIARSLVQRFGLHAAGRPQKISGIGGVEQAVPVSVSNWNTGPIRLPTAVIVSAAIPSERGVGLEGLIGSDIWSRFGKFTLDYSSGTLTVYKQIATAEQDLNRRTLEAEDGSRALIGYRGDVLATQVLLR
jgi:predicted aspartyl protease